AAVGEFIGMTVFIFLALSGVQGDLEAPTGIAHDLGITPSQIQSIALSFGVGVTVALFISGPISGGVLNPAILLSLMISGNINWLRGIFYFIAQMGGAILGAYFSNFVTAHELQGVNLLNPGFNYAQGFFAELLLTCCLCLTVLFVIVDKTSLADFAPFVVGTAIFICHLIGAPIDGTSINPARSFAASLVTGKWANHWIFWFGPLIGAFFAAVIY
ncbi:major intrinsic protein, partial [Pilaira anomala]